MIFGEINSIINDISEGKKYWCENIYKKVNIDTKQIINSFPKHLFTHG